jgi:hypothetical protein
VSADSKVPLGVNPADFEAAMRPEAGDPWEPLPHDVGWWVMSFDFGWLGPFRTSAAAQLRAEGMTYLDNWQEVRITTLSAPAFDDQPF